VLSTNIAQILKAPVGTERFLEVLDEINFNKEIIGVDGEVKLTRTNYGILAQGQLNAMVKIQCCRCLKKFSCPLTFKFAEEFFPLVDIHTGIGLNQPEDADSFTISADHVLNISEALRQYALLALPMKPLCSFECYGFTPPDR